MRRLVAVAAAAGLFVTMLGAPAGADAPVHEQFSVTFTDINPCTESDMEVTINFDVALHEHRNNFVATLQRTGTVEPGAYTMVSGNETFVANRGGERGHFNDVWHSGDGSSSFRAWGVFVYNAQQDELKVDRFRLQCIR